MEYIKAFIVGGILCVIAQVLIDKTKLTPARILTGYVVLGVVLSALGLYQPLCDFAGCGASVPLTGFGHLLAKGVRQAIQQKGAFGILLGPLTSGAAGITTAILAGLVVALLFKSKTK